MSTPTTHTTKTGSFSWKLTHTSKYSPDNVVVFTYDNEGGQNSILIHYRYTGEVFVKSVEDARKDWQHLVKAGFKS